MYILYVYISIYVYIICIYVFGYKKNIHGYWIQLQVVTGTHRSIRSLPNIILNTTQNTMHSDISGGVGIRYLDPDQMPMPKLNCIFT